MRTAVEHKTATGDKGQIRSKRRDFFPYAAAILFATSSPLCCGCKAKPSSGVDGDSVQQVSTDFCSGSRIKRPTTSGGKRRTASDRDRHRRMELLRESVQRKSRFKEDLGADHLDTVELMMEFEEEFDINISDDVAVKTLTVGQAIDLVARLLGNRPVPPRKSRPKAPPSGRRGPATDLNRRKP